MDVSNSMCKFKIPKNSNSRNSIFLINFSNGQINFNGSSHLEFTCYRHELDENADSTARRIVVASNGRLNYKGVSFENNDPLKLSLRYCIGVLNKNSGKMKIYECVFLQLKPIIKKKMLSNSEFNIAPEKNFREKIDLLTMNFGSKGKKRAVNSRLKYTIDSCPIESNIQDIRLNESSSIDQKDTRSTLSTIHSIPPQNASAQTPSEVYNIRDIISEDEDEHLVYFAELLLQKSPTSKTEENGKNIFCKYVSSHLEMDIDLKKAKYLVYYNFLVMFSKLTYRDIVKKDPMPDIGEPFKSKLLDCFAITSCSEMGKITRNLPHRMKDKLFAHLFVLALIIDDYCVNIPLVSEDLKLGVQSLIRIAQAVGCHIIQRKVNNSVEKYAELKLPLFTFAKFSKNRN